MTPSREMFSEELMDIMKEMNDEPEPHMLASEEIWLNLVSDMRELCTPDVDGDLDEAARLTTNSAYQHRWI